MAQIIDFLSRKKQIEDNKKASMDKKTDRPIASFSIISQRNNQAKEKIRKERELANKNVMKNYRIK